MKAKKVLTRFAAAPEDEQERKRVARALGDELHRQRLDVLREFRAGLSRVHLREGSFSAGYVNGLLDVVAEYEVFVKQLAEEEELARTALREDWRAVLAELANGPKLPSELAHRLGKDRPSITRILKRLRSGGLVHAYASDSLDGRRRPHRLTVQGRRLLESLEHVSADVERGISIAVGLFRHLVSHASSPASSLGAIANQIVDNPDEAARAVNIWVDQLKRAGLIAEIDPRDTPDGQFHIKPQPPALADDHSDTLWTRAPSILDEIKQRKDEQVPVYVRTHDATWGAWAYALQNDTTGLSRTIVNGDILSRAIHPPDRRFDLVYDDPEAIDADRNEPTMQAFWAQAEEKFVVTSAEEDVPEGFIQLKLVPKKD